MSPEILNPESKVGALNLKSFKSGEFCRACYILCFTKMEGLVVLLLMTIDGARWLFYSVTGLCGNFYNR